jgi:hypothetical protein
VYQNIQVHDESKVTLGRAEKEFLQHEIELKMALDFDGFLEVDWSLSMVTLVDMEISGEQDQEYWLYAMRAALAAKALADGHMVVDTLPD